jgi:large subunit ribosomal protein L6e
VDLKGIDEKVLEKVSADGYFTKDKAARKPGEDSFFKQGDKPEVCNTHCTQLGRH